MELQEGLCTRDSATAKRTPARTGLLGAAALLLALATVDASAATFRYSASSNRIYVEGGGIATLSDIKNAVPLAPVDQIDTVNHIWLLRANLIIADGSVLQLHGVAKGGDVDVLRIQSNNTTDVNAVVSITADYGGIDMLGVNVTSWDTDAGAPDTQHANGRAFIRVRSRFAIDGVTPLESRMDVVDSEVSNLGSDFSEGYGLVWKVTGTDPDLTAKVHVYGDIINSRIHHCYQATYTFGHKAGTWLDSQFDHNVSYGIYVHDDSNDMVIDGNNVHDNGSDGIYLTEGARRATVTDNKSWNNTGHGIRLRHGSNFATVDGNEVYGNSDSGIALFAASNATISHNLVHNNGTYGIRLTQSSDNNLISGNEINGNAREGIYVYLDVNTPPPAGDDGRPDNNTFIANNVHDNLGYGFKAVNADFNKLQANTFKANGTPTILFQYARRNQMSANRLAAGITTKLIGDASIETVLRVTNQKVLPLQLDGFSAATFIDRNNYIYDVTQSVSAQAVPTKATLALTSAKLGTTSTTVFKRNLQARPTAATTVLVNPVTWDTLGDLHKTWVSKSTDGTVPVAYTVGDLAAGTSYRVTQDGVVIGTFAAGAAGKISFTATPGTTNSITYVVAPAP
jgi:mannuronan 5-epimerase